MWCWRSQANASLCVAKALSNNFFTVPLKFNNKKVKIEYVDFIHDPIDEIILNQQKGQEFLELIFPENFFDPVVYDAHVSFVGQENEHEIEIPCYCPEIENKKNETVALLDPKPIPVITDEDRMRVNALTLDEIKYEQNSDVILKDVISWLKNHLVNYLIK